MSLKMAFVCRALTDRQTIKPDKSLQTYASWAGIRYNRGKIPGRRGPPFMPNKI